MVVVVVLVTCGVLGLVTAVFVLVQLDLNPTWKPSPPKPPRPKLEAGAGWTWRADVLRKPAAGLPYRVKSIGGKR